MIPTTSNRNILIFVIVVVFIGLIVAGLLIYFFMDHFNKQDCFIHINKDQTQQHPLILNISANQFYLPNHENGLIIKNGEKIILSCPGNNNYIQQTVDNFTEIDATCVKNKTFQINNNNYEFKQLKCMNHPEIVAKYSGNNCSNIYHEINVGFATKRGFITLYTNCFNHLKMDTLYSRFNLTTKIKTYQYTKRPRFKSLHFYKNLTVDPGVIYTRKYQQRHFEEILGTSKYISLNSDYFLARGHLTAKADFVYSAQQRATFLYINVAPQWQTFNGKNWMELENSVRNLVATKNNDLVVYTGVYGSASLLNINGTNVNLTLFNNNKLTVPEFFWKIIHDPLTKKGIVFIGHNNPYETVINRYCTDICDKINWVITWNRFNLTTGFSYCCDYHAFKTIVDYAPELSIDGILI